MLSHLVGQLRWRWIDTMNNCLKKKREELWMLDKQGECYMIGMNGMSVKGNTLAIAYRMNLQI